MIEHPKIQHDLRTILNVAINYMNLMYNEANFKNDNTFLMKVTSSLTQFSELLDILAFLSESEKGKYNSIKERFNLHEQINKVASDFRNKYSNFKGFVNVIIPVNFTVIKDKKLLYIITKSLFTICYSNSLGTSTLIVKLNYIKYLDIFTLEFQLLLKEMPLPDFHIIYASPLDSHLSSHVALMLISAKKTIQLLEGNIELSGNDNQTLINILIPFNKQELVTETNLEPCTPSVCRGMKLLLTESDPITSAILRKAASMLGLQVSLTSISQLEDYLRDLKDQIVVVLDDLYVTIELEKRILDVKSPFSKFLLLKNPDTFGNFQALRSKEYSIIHKPVTLGAVINKLEAIAGDFIKQEFSSTFTKDNKTTLALNDIERLTYLLKTGKRSLAMKFTADLNIEPNLKNVLLQALEAFDYKKAMDMLSNVRQ